MDVSKRSVGLRVKTKLGESDTWLIVAVLALALWTIDALQMYLQMHRPLAAGLGAFASHFWYALPVTAAIVVLSRLRPRAELLGLTVYDEAGQVMLQQGSFHLDEFAARGLHVALKDRRRQGLHRLVLPSGPRLYFLGDGGFTWVLCFSGPASSRDLEAGIHRFQPERPPVHFDLLFGLDPETAALAVNLLSSPTKRNALAYLYHFKLTAVQVADLAYRLRESEEDVARALDDLGALGLVEVQCVCEHTFHRLSGDAAIRNKLDVLFAWQAKWQLQIERLDGMLRIS